MLRACLAQLLPNVSAVALGSEDPRHLHQARVALRRLRTALRELGDLSDAVSLEWEPLLAQAFRGLGAARDRQALLESIGPELDEAGLKSKAWLEGSAGEQPSPASVLRDSRFQEVLLALLSFAMQDEDVAVASEPAESVALQTALRERLEPLRRRLRKDAKAFAALDEDARHRSRKRLKRLRYLAEFVAPLYPGPAAARFLKRLEPVQDALGRHNDLVVASALAKQAAAQGDADAAQALDWLRKQRKRSRKASAKALLKLRKAPRFWRVPAQDVA